MPTTGKKIYVRSEDFGWLSEKPISFQIKNLEGTIVYCDHKGAVETEEICEVYHAGRDDYIDIKVKVLTCKCGAYKKEGEKFWEDAPEDGVSYEQ